MQWEETMNKIKAYLTSPRRSTRDISQIVFLTLLLAAVFTLINQNFVGRYNLISIGQNLAPYAILTLGVMMPISMGGIDLSIGANCVAAAVVAGKLHSMGMPLGLVIPVMIAFGSAVGLVNGFFIAVYNIQPFIVTLGTMMFIRGVSAIFAATATVLYPADCWYNYIFSNFHGFPISFLWIALFAVLVYYMFRRTKWGRYMTSIGSNERSVRIAGVDVVRCKIIGYTLSGLLAGIAGIFWSASFVTVPVATGNGMELDAVAGVFIGGTAASGGFVNVIGGIVGSILLVVIRSGLNFALARLNVQINSTYVTYALSGIIVILAVLSERAKSSGSASRKKSAGGDRSIAVTVTCMILSVVMAVFLAVSAFTAGHQAGQVSGKKLCILMKSEGSAFWRTLEVGASDAAAASGYEVVCRGAETEGASQLPRQLEIGSAFIAENPAGIAVAALADGCVDFLKTAYENGIPVMEFDSGLYAVDKETITASDENPLFSYVKADNYKNAQLIAENVYKAVRDEIISSEHYNVGVIQHEVTASGELRANGFVDRFTELAEGDPETKGKSTVYVEIKPSGDDNAYKAALEYLYEKDHLELVYSTAEPVINQVLDAVQSAGSKYDEIRFASYDIAPKVLEWLKADGNDRIVGALDQDPYTIGYLTAEAMVKKDRGEDVEDEILVTGVWYDKGNIEEYKTGD